MTVDIAALRERAANEVIENKGFVSPELSTLLLDQLEAIKGHYDYRNDVLTRAIAARESAETKLEAAQTRIAELEGEQEPAGYFVNTLEDGVRGMKSISSDSPLIKVATPLYTATPKPVIKLPDYIQRISESLKTQDNRITDQPMFVVFEKREVIGSDEHSPSRIVWCKDGEEVSELRAKRLEALHQGYRATDLYDRYPMQEIDVFVTACFTEKGCKDYLSINGHNLRLPYIFAAGSYRNNEYQQVRNWIISGCTVESE